MCGYYGDIFKCECPQGYSGETCEITPCTGDPCNDRGDCEVFHSTFNCNCFDGYFGQSCQNNPCEPDPCENHGICNFNEHGADCNCPDGFTGDRCEITPCSPEPCTQYARVDPDKCKLIPSADKPTAKGWVQTLFLSNLKN